MSCLHKVRKLEVLVIISLKLSSCPNYEKYRTSWILIHCFITLTAKSVRLRVFNFVEVNVSDYTLRRNLIIILYKKSITVQNNNNGLFLLALCTYKPN